MMRIKIIELLICNRTRALSYYFFVSLFIKKIKNYELRIVYSYIRKKKKYKANIIFYSYYIENII